MTIIAFSPGKIPNVMKHCPSIAGFGLRQAALIRDEFLAGEAIKNSLNVMIPLRL